MASVSERGRRQKRGCECVEGPGRDSRDDFLSNGDGGLVELGVGLGSY